MCNISSSDILRVYSWKAQLEQQDNVKRVCIVMKNKSLINSEF